MRQPCKCGSDSIAIQQLGPLVGQGAFYGECQKCKRTGPACGDPEDAVASWNDAAKAGQLDDPVPMIPIYEQNEDQCPDGMYLALFHGRDTITEDMNDWGYSGPLIGPLRYVHTTYDSNVKIAFMGGSDDLILRPIVVYGMQREDEIIFRTKEGLLPFGGKFYGDWTVFNLVGGKVVQ